MSCLPARSPAAIMASQSSTVGASGFSHSTCLPAAKARSTSPRCSAFGVMT